MGKPKTPKRRRISRGPQTEPSEFQQPAVAVRNGIRRWLALLALLALVLVGATAWSLAGQSAEPLRYEVVREFPHDNTAYCQGLVINDGVLYEGTGQYGRSSVRRVDLETGTPLQQLELDPTLFGEGVTVWQDQLVQLTWKSGLGFIYHKETFAELGRFSYVGQGWGLTHDGKHWIMSDGSATLRYLDPQNQRVTRRLKVRNGKFPVRYLNELEYIDGQIFANVFMRDYIVRISPRNGQVTGVLDLSQLHPRRNWRTSEDVLNGIAYDAKGGRLFVTGKNWPKLFEIRLVE